MMDKFLLLSISLVAALNLATSAAVENRAVVGEWMFHVFDGEKARVCACKEDCNIGESKHNHSKQLYLSMNGVDHTTIECASMTA